MPVSQGEIQTVEKVQKDYFSRIPGLRGLNYHQQLTKMKMNSLQRRHERYRIIYTWKVLEGLVPNCGVDTVPGWQEDRQGRRCSIPSVNTRARAAVQTIREQYFFFK